jgi:AcrR family transcriptional regulator
VTRPPARNFREKVPALEVRKHRETRRLLVQHAIGLVEEVGLAGFSAREVARRAGVSHAAPFRHFPSGAALLTEAAVSGFQDLRGRLVAVARYPVATKHDLVIRLGVEYVAFAQQRPAMFELMFRSDLMSCASEPANEHRLSVLVLFVDGASKDDAPSAIAREACLLAGVHGLADLASQGLLSPLTREQLQSTLECHVLARLPGLEPTRAEPLAGSL